MGDVAKAVLFPPSLLFGKKKKSDSPSPAEAAKQAAAESPEKKDEEQQVQQSQRPALAGRSQLIKGGPARVGVRIAGEGSGVAANGVGGING